MRLNITAEFAKKHDCLDRMIPSDLRLLVSERDAALRERDALRELLKAAECPNNCIDKGGYYDNMGEVSQCQFCHEYSKLVQEPSKQQASGSESINSLCYSQQNPA